VDPLPALTDALRASWGAEAAVRRVEWPLTLKVGRKVSQPA
jgi:hypothetical protein